VAAAHPQQATPPSAREAVRDPNDPLRIVVVRDMWLTGFDAPSLHTMYVDKPMRGHGLMQAIARVNRVFRDKPGGLVVDYLGLAHELKAALATYTESGGTGRTAIDQREAVALMLAKYEVCCAMFHGFDWAIWVSGSPAQRLRLLPAALEHILAQEDGKNRLLRAVNELSQAFALAVPADEALRICDDVSFFQAVRASPAKRAPRRVEDAGGAGPRRAPDRLARSRTGRRRRHLRGSRFGEARRLDPVRRVSRRRARDAAAATWRWYSCRSCCTARSRHGRGALSSRGGRSLTCWSRLCGSTRTARSKPRR